MQVIVLNAKIGKINHFRNHGGHGEIQHKAH
jgi:hypothetical protein